MERKTLVNLWSAPSITDFYSRGQGYHPGIMDIAIGNEFEGYNEANCDGDRSAIQPRSRHWRRLAKIRHPQPSVPRTGSCWVGTGGFAFCQMFREKPHCTESFRIFISMPLETMRRSSFRPRQSIAKASWHGSLSDA